MSRQPDRERSEATEAGKPKCSECGRRIIVGAATNDRWLCEYCLVVESFQPMSRGV